MCPMCTMCFLATPFIEPIALQPSRAALFRAVAMETTTSMPVPPERWGVSYDDLVFFREAVSEAVRGGGLLPTERDQRLRPVCQSS